MTSPANALEPSAQVVEKGAALVSASTLPRRPAGQPAKTAAGGSEQKRADQKWVPAEASSATSHPGLLGSSLQRLYESGGSTGMGPLLLSQSQHKNSSATSSDLTDSLLEAVFEISEFDPLPHLNCREEEFGFSLLAGSPHYAAPAKNAPSKTGTVEAVPGPGQSHLNISPDGLSGVDRRKLPRRESECTVSVCKCRGEERLTAERIAWMLHATKLKGQLVDVSMSGVAFHLMESLAAGSTILLRISNRTLDKQVDASATILRSRAASDGGWDVVCRFNKNLTFEQIHTVGRSLFAATIV